MGETAMLTNISDMIDLAIGTPEVGTVDFCMLQTVLHCLAQQLAVLDKNVELRNTAGLLALPPGKELVHSVAVNEYILETDDKAGDKPLKKHEKLERIKKEGSRAEEVPASAVETGAAAGAPGGAGGGQQGAGGGQQGARGQLSASGQPSSRTSVSHLPAGEKISLVSWSKFNLLESVVEDLKNRVYGSMPKNEDILEEVRSQTNLKAITDMWTSLNVSSRLEAAETGLTKLSSLVQDLIGESTNLQEMAKQRDAKSAPEAAAAGLPAGASEELAAVKDDINQLRSDLDDLANTFNTAMQDMGGASQSEGATPRAAGAAQEAEGPEATERRQTQVPERRPTSARRPSNSAAAEMMERLAKLEKRIQQCCDSISKKDGTSQDQMSNFQDQLEALSKQMADITKDLSAGKLSPDLVKDLQGLMELFKTVQDMQAQLKEVHDTALQLAAEKEDRQAHMNALLEQIEILKTIKLDREDMVEAMADKADLRMLARKVSHDQFEMACDDLSRGLEHAIGKLNVQESLWQQALDDIQREIETKLDKMELSPVKEFFNNKLRQLQEHLKKMASLRREAEAADAIRKAQATNMPQRNLNDWETIDKQMSQPKPPQKVRSETDKHICNRYCGGSHTVTTPAQRVARTGHFIKQWGPDVVPLSSGYATGDDGRLYKVSPVEGANVGPGGAVDAACTKKPTSDAKPVSKPLIISAILPLTDDKSG
ncbi:hypothetical protein MSG28_000481 [Choristoneura fumiferana]|uniref:Uncharacterized protein n=1 Tax=Choristoneura fumiferana TaxID=7141 RepID=A0ACC0K105_CHOFU|nr:hypothetical protein MSG28_000481 [Choristoneura fumiferana]